MCTILFEDLLSRDGINMRMGFVLGEELYSGFYCPLLGHGASVHNNKWCWK